MSPLKPMRGLPSINEHEAGKYLPAKSESAPDGQDESRQSGTFWTKSELFLTKIPTLTFRSAPAFPPAEFRRAKQNNFLSIFCILRAPFFLLKGIENCFALMFGLTPNGGNASHPQPRFAGQSRRAKISSPRPPSFLPARLGFALKFFERADGGASN